MHRSLRHLLVIGGVAGGVAGIAPACADNAVSIYVRGVLAPNDDCTFQCAPDTLRLPGGQLDVNVDTAYTATVLVGNQLVPQADPDTPRAESARVRLEGVEVRVETVEAAPRLLAEFTVPGTGLVDPAGFDCIAATLLDPATTQLIRSEFANTGNTVLDVVVFMRPFGTTLGGMELTSGESVYPIRVCACCGVTCTPTALCADVVKEAGTVCTPGQDSILSSCVLPESIANECGC